MVITPPRVEECFADFQAILANIALKFEKVGDRYVVWKNSQRALFCEGDRGTSVSQTQATLCVIVET